MKKHLTARNVCSLPIPTPAQRQQIYWDEVLPNFGVRVSYGGERAYVVRYRVGGRRRKLTVGSSPLLSLADARTEAKRILRDAELGLDAAQIKQDRRDAGTFRELAELYLADIRKRKKSWREDERIVRSNLLPAWGDVKVIDLARRDVRALLGRVAERAPVMANRVLAVVRPMLNFAVDREWIEANPSARVAKPTTEESRERVLTRDERRELWVALSETERTDSEDRPVARLNAALNAALKVMLLTAQRPGEVASMRWADVDLESHWWTIRREDTKNGEVHRVPLTPACMEILRERRRASLVGEPWVFSNTPGSNVADRAKKAASFLSRGRGRYRAGLSFEFRAQDLRRTAATGMGEAGVPRDHISRVLNHVDGGPRATSTYLRYEYDAEKRAALDAWAARLGAHVGGDEKIFGYSRAS